MSRTTLTVLAILLLFAAVDAVLIGRRLSSRREASPEHALIAKKYATRSSLVRMWEKEPAVPLASPSLVSQLSGMIEDDRIPQSPAVQQVPLASLSSDQRHDLYQALCGLMRAYAQNSPEMLFEYMRGRHLQLARERRRIIEEYLSEVEGRAKAQLETLSDHDLYVSFWRASINRCPQTTVLPTASRIAVWRWTGPEAPQILDPLSFSALRRIPDVWAGYMTVASNFTPSEPFTLASQLQSKQEAVVADVELVIGHDKDMLFAKAPYMVRLWYNEGYRQWQPLLLLVAHPSGESSLNLSHIIF